MLETILSIILAPVALIAILFLVCIAIGFVKAFSGRKCKGAIIYAGDEDRVEFFKEIISTLGLKTRYDVRVVDGEYEIIIK